MVTIINHFVAINIISPVLSVQQNDWLSITCRKLDVVLRTKAGLNITVQIDGHTWQPFVFIQPGMQSCEG